MTAGKPRKVVYQPLRFEQPDTFQARFLFTLLVSVIYGCATAGPDQSRAARSGNFDHIFPDILTTSTLGARGRRPRGIYRFAANPEG